jgi:hypothetical protein
MGLYRTLKELSPTNGPMAQIVKHAAQSVEATSAPDWQNKPSDHEADFHFPH